MSSLFRRAIFGWAIASLASPLTATAATTIYVDINAAGPVHDGSTWCSAYIDLNEALIAANQVDTTILVAGGVYVPSPAGLEVPRAATFALLSPVTIRGGYAGCGAPDPDAFDPSAHPTVLSGDLDNNDHIGLSGKLGNTCHVVTVMDDTGGGHRLEYVTISGGNANANDCGQRSAEGGGILCVNAAPTFFHTTFVDNLAYFGGAIYLDGCRATFGNCTFEKNKAILGGAVMDTGLVSATRLEDCTVLGNEATGDGGALYFLGRVNDNVKAPGIFNTLLASNHAAGEGGAIHSVARDFDLQSSTVVENTSSNAESGGIYTYEASARLLNSIAWANEGILGRTEFAQVFPDASRRPTAAGSVFDPIVDYSCVEGWSGTFSGVESFGDDPRFLPGPEGCYYLDPGDIEVIPPSPCVNAGSDTAQVLGLSDRTTAPNEASDESQVDLGYHYPIAGRGTVLADYNRTGRVDLADVAAFQNCYLGIPLEEAPICCRIFDATADGELDLVDFGELTLDGPN